MGQMFYCAANYVTSFRVNGATQTLAKSVLTVCRNDRCYSRNLKDLPLGRISRVGFSMRGYLFPEPTAARNTPWITVEMSWSANCGVYCDLWVTYKCAPGDSLSACTESDMTHDGDVYEVSIRSPSGRKQSLRDTAHYDVFTFDGKECDSFKTDHTDEAMWTLD